MKHSNNGEEKKMKERLVRDEKGFVIVSLMADQYEYCKECIMARYCKVILQAGEECMEKEVE